MIYPNEQRMDRIEGRIIQCIEREQPYCASDCEYPIWSILLNNDNDTHEFVARFAIIEATEHMIEREFNADSLN